MTASGEPVEPCGETVWDGSVAWVGGVIPGHPHRESQWCHGYIESVPFPFKEYRATQDAHGIRWRLDKRPRLPVGCDNSHGWLLRPSVFGWCMWVGTGDFSEPWRVNGADAAPLVTADRIVRNVSNPEDVLNGSCPEFPASVLRPPDDVSPWFPSVSEARRWALMTDRTRG